MLSFYQSDCSFGNSSQPCLSHLPSLKDIDKPNKQVQGQSGRVRMTYGQSLQVSFSLCEGLGLEVETSYLGLWQRNLRRNAHTHHTPPALWLTSPEQKPRIPVKTLASPQPCQAGRREALTTHDPICSPTLLCDSHNHDGVYSCGLFILQLCPLLPRPYTISTKLSTVICPKLSTGKLHPIFKDIP